MNTRRLALAAALDAASVTVFVAIGRRNHDQEPGLGGVFVTAAPFLIALVLGWIVARAWQHPDTLRAGLVIWITTLIGGMLLRNLVFSEGTAASFMIVAALFTGACLMGWRLVAALIRRRSFNR